MMISISKISNRNNEKLQHFPMRENMKKRMKKCNKKWRANQQEQKKLGYV